MVVRRRLLALIYLVLAVCVSAPASAQDGGENSSLPAAREAITADNLDRLVRLTILPIGLPKPLAWSANSKLLAIVGPGPGSWKVGLYNIDDVQAPPRTIETGATSALALSPDGALLATGNGDGTTGTITLWNIADSTPITITSDLKSLVGAIAFSPDGSLLVASDMDSLHLYGIDADALELVQTETGLRSAELAFSPDGRLLAATDSWVFKVYGLHGYQPDMILQNEGFSARNIVFSPDGTRLAGVSSPGPNSQLALWDLQTGTQLLVDNWGQSANSEYSSSNNDVSFSADGSLVAASNGGKLAFLFDATTGAPLATLRSSPEDLIIRLAFSPDGTLLALTGGWGSDTYVELWGVPQ